jgi:hypothetical protein
MQDDLLHAKASVEWAVAQFPVQSRLDAWLNININVSVKELPPDSQNNLIIATEKEAIPLTFNVEVGTYINAIRSSLDILASALAARHCPLLIDEAYFPMASSPERFASGNYKGSKFIKALPIKERDIFKSLNPYKGENEFLYALHNLDVVRKHVRLLTVPVQPARLGISRKALPYFEPLSIAWMRSSDEETVLGLLRKDAPDPQLSFTAQISFDETSYLGGIGVIPALHNFAILARGIIFMFDTQ